MIVVLINSLDGKAGLVTGLRGGNNQERNRDGNTVFLLPTCCGSKSLKVIPLDSEFGAYPVLNPLGHHTVLQIDPVFKEAR